MTSHMLRDWRREFGLSQAELAARLGVDQSYVSSYETGRRSPGIDVLARFAGGLDQRLVIELEPIDADLGARRADNAAGPALTIRQLADHLSATDDDGRRRRLVLEFVRGHTDADPATRHGLYRQRPGETGTPFDALLGGLAEHLAFHDARDAPQWVYEPVRFLDRAWYFVDVPRLRGLARMSSPAALARRLVFVDRSDLERV